MRAIGARLIGKLASLVQATREGAAASRVQSALQEAPAPIRLAFEAGAASAVQRVLVLADNFAATQYISFVQPMADRCARGEAALAVIAEGDIDKMTTAAFRSSFAAFLAAWRPTAIVFSRAGTRFAGAVLEQAHAIEARVVAHLDDDLFAVPAALGASKAALHNDPARLARLMIACRRADVIYASTAALGDMLAARFPDRPIVRGRIYAAATEPFQAFRAEGRAVFGYMGTAGHVGDLESIAPAIIQVLERVPDARFETFGTIKPPASLARFGARVAAHARTADYPSFLLRLKSLGWRVGLAPLQDTSFNACKADTKFVEYAVAGIPAILQRSDVYRRPLNAEAAIGAAAQEEWANAIGALMEDEGLAFGYAEKAQSFLRSDYSIGALEAQLNDVFGPSHPD